MKQISFIFLFSIIISATLTAVTPDWVKSYGTVNPFSDASHLTGFAMISKDDSEFRNTVIDKSLTDLSKKIKIMIQSEQILEEIQSGDNYDSAVSSITRSTVNTTVSDADYIFYEDRKNLFCLSYVVVESLKQSYADEATGIWYSISQAYGDARELSDNGKSDEALAELYDNLKFFPEIYELWSLYRAVDSSSPDSSFFSGFSSMSSIEDLLDFESGYSSLMDDISSRDASNLREGLAKMAWMMAMQGVPGGAIKVSPFLFESTSFSSEFGRYAADLMEPALVDELNRGGDEIIFRGQYWDEGAKIRLIVIAMNTEGEKLGKADVLIPSSARGNRDLKPQNFDQAMIAMSEFSEGALSDGGINVDIWTNKGADEDALVFSEGEILQLYFRVNQPSFLQITYCLATGEKVLLEPSFFIGMDMVNRAVPLPYEFEVQAPFGVEQMIVTAFSVEPPPAITIPTVIDGESYEVFKSVRDVVMSSRGLKRSKKNTEEVRVGEAMLNMTMLPR
ncbi:MULTISPECIES: hypothetical protein [unclassified Oceanispirochaeta]|uniref:hypothetical protein n=1 Tax=unclassified Oceanispirochaeta TaxID=2635722 RepID=UPI000E099CCE|nr:MULTISPECIES: hypothetical protein [unclassified Oceanispirochaeta]MBF9015454.1 hypothetical protein [Oceanispirochaeta sp. M2]NPD71913.1 hypothetical protein [Oceanispirochaeta sp. M1]RDG32722.1 hypothetical protein DV872_07365 [Oceanispirochaeta sp. M1]